MRRTLTLIGAIACLLFTALGTGTAGAVPFEITSFEGGVFEQGGAEATQAGSHPFRGSATFRLNYETEPSGFFRPIGSIRNALADLPPGLVGNPRAVPACSGAIPAETRCPDNTQVGYAATIGNFLHPNSGKSYYPLYNMETQPGTPALFKFTDAGVPIMVRAKLRTGGDYGITLVSVNAPETLPNFGVDFTIWGVPASPSHDSERGYKPGSIALGSPCVDPANSPFCSNPWVAPPGWGSPAIKPFVSLPTSCAGPVDTHIRIETWEGEADEASFTSPGGTECDSLEFKPTLEARPTTNLADSPSGLNVDLKIPQNEDFAGRSTAHLRDTVVTLPEGMTINPSAANGLEACTPAQIAIHDEGPASCPDASKIGTVEVDTPVLDHPIDGALYIASPYDNPFDSLLALYIAVDDPQTGIIVKLAGEVHADPGTGQLTTSFRDNPQLPFEHFKLHVFGGAGGSLRTPPTCGAYATTSSLAPWSGTSPETPVDDYAIEAAPGGGTCPTAAAQLPSAPSFDAGTASAIAAAHTPLLVDLRREDGTQPFSSLTLNPPPGLVGKLAGVPYCPDDALAAAAARTGKSEQASPSCPAASRVGTVIAGAGAGPTPYFASGTAYLAGPYKGAPISLAIVTPAVAGPFDLGTIVVRTALFVDSKTAQITAVSDPIPQILQGIPLDVRSIQVRLDRPDFTINPTSCDLTTFGGQLLSPLGLTTPLQSRFQLAECSSLGFRPKLSLRLDGGTKRSDYPALTAVLRTRPGDANLASISVALPHSEFLAQQHIRTVCTRVQFAADQCPKGAIYGTATVTTPLLDYPLTGPVYLRSSSNQLPDLVPDLRGPASQPIKLEAAGRTDSIHGGIRNSFEFIPDAPFTQLVLKMQGGSKGLLQNSRNICAHKVRATVNYGAHNGRTAEERPVLNVPSCKKAGKRKHHGKHRHAH